MGSQGPLWEAGRRVRARMETRRRSRLVFRMDPEPGSAGGPWRQAEARNGAFLEPAETQAADTEILVQGAPF